MGFFPEATYFKPIGIPLSFLDQVSLSLDELEALRLADFNQIDQIEAAKKMKVSQSTFQRILCSARKKVSGALVIGQAIKVEGGEISMPITPGMGRGRGRGMGRGRMGGQFSAGPGGVCLCTNPDCKNEIPHQTGVPCFKTKCPKCGSPMIRKV